MTLPSYGRKPEPARSAARIPSDEKAMIVLRRPGPAELSEADAYIFRLVQQAAIGRETAPWAFHVVGPDGIREVTEREASLGTAG